MPKRKTTPRRSARPSRTVLVTGASGRLGRNLCHALLDKGVEVRSLASHDAKAHMLPVGTIPYVGDITDAQALRKACDGVDAVYHLAALVTQRHSGGMHEIMRINAHGTKNVLEAAESSGVKRFIFSSSVDVYGVRRDETLTEESQVQPTDMYGHSKAMAEQIIESFGGKVDYTIFRSAAMYGPGFEHSFFKIFKMLVAGKAYIVGSGQNVLGLIHADDVTRAFTLALEQKGARRNVFNLSDGKRYTQEYLLKMAAEALNAPVPKKHVSTLLVRVLGPKVGFSPDEIRFITSNRIIDISRIKKELGFRPRVEITKATKALVQEYLTHRKQA